jgi:hypothetical protein
VNRLERIEKKTGITDILSMDYLMAENLLDEDIM